MSLKRGQQNPPKLKCKENENKQWNHFKKCNIYIIELPEKEGREHRAEEISEVRMSEKFPTLMKDITHNRSRKLREHQEG